MENSELHELIEQYLEGSLSTEQRQAVEARIATDPGFRAEVDLHRQLHAEFADPKKLALRDMLGEVVGEPLSPRGNYARFKWPGIALGLFILLLLAWLWLSPAPEAPVAPAGQEEIKSGPTELQPDDTLPAQKIIPPKPGEPIAMADPKNFIPNRDFEARLGSQIRDAGGAAEMQSPAPGAAFAPEKSLVRIPFRGKVSADADTARYPLVLNIYNNRPDSGKALFRLLPAIADRNTNPWSFSIVRQLRMQPGLYYFTLERIADEDLIFVGKFTVRAQ